MAGERKERRAKRTGRRARGKGIEGETEKEEWKEGKSSSQQ